MIVITGILVATPTIGGISMVSATTTGSDFLDQFSQSEEPQQQGGGFVPFQDTTTNDTTINDTTPQTPQTNATTQTPAPTESELTPSQGPVGQNQTEAAQAPTVQALGQNQTEAAQALGQNQTEAARSPGAPAGVGALVTKLAFHDAAGNSVGCTNSGVGVGVAFDGTNLWFSCYLMSPDLYRADPHTGLVTATYTIVGNLGAMAYDKARNAIWAASGNTIYLIQLDASKNMVSSKIAFSPSDLVGITLIDGLAYDGLTDLLYLSADTEATIHKYTTAGNHLGNFNWAGAGCGNSGLAIGGNLLFQGADGCTHVYAVNKNTPATIVFDFNTNIGNDPNFRDEDLECDTNTFSTNAAPKHVMWSMEAYEPRRAAAFEIPIDTCGTGGVPPPPECNIQHWDKIVFSINNSRLAGSLRLTPNTPLDIKVLDDPARVADIKQKVLNFLKVPASPENRRSISIIDIEYAIICAQTRSISNVPIEQVPTDIPNNFTEQQQQELNGTQALQQQTQQPDNNITATMGGAAMSNTTTGANATGTTATGAATNTTTPTTNGGGIGTTDTGTIAAQPPGLTGTQETTAVPESGSAEAEAGIVDEGSRSET